MKRTCFTSILIALAMSLSFSITGAAQTAFEQIEESFQKAEESYRQGFMTPADMTGTPGAEDHDLPVVGTILLVMGSESDAESLYDLFITMSEEDEYSIKAIADLGDEAAFIVEPSAQHAENIVLARTGEVVIMSIGGGEELDPNLQEDIIRHIMEHGPSEAAVSTDDSGIVTGGWADAFPQPEDIEGLEMYAPAPVVVFELEEPPVAATPAKVSAVEVATPTIGTPTVIATPKS